MSQNCDQLHILIISNSYPTINKPNAGIFWRDQAISLSKIGHKVAVIAVTPISLNDIIGKGPFFSLTKSENEGVYEMKFSFPNIPKFNFFESYIALWKGKSFFKKYIKINGKPDVIHLHRYEGGLLALYLKKKYKLPIVYTEHSSRFLYDQLSKKEKKIASKVILDVDYRIAVSPFLGRKIEKTFGVKFNFIPNIVDTEQFDIKSTTFNKDNFVVFSAGNLAINKNHKILIEAFRDFKIKYPNSELFIAGEGNQRKFLEIEIKKYDLFDSVKLVGQLSRNEMIDWFNKSNVFVLPSKKETFGVVIIEALSCGIPVVSTKSGGPNYIIENKEIGELCECTSQSLFKSMVSVYENRAFYSKEEIRNYAIRRYSKEIVLEKMINLYDKLKYGE